MGAADSVELQDGDHGKLAAFSRFSHLHCPRTYTADSLSVVFRVHVNFRDIAA